jgi:hypothetical protein
MRRVQVWKSTPSKKVLDNKLRSLLQLLRRHPNDPSSQFASHDRRDRLELALNSLSVVGDRDCYIVTNSDFAAAFKAGWKDVWSG